MYHSYAYSHTNSAFLEEYIMIGIPSKAKSTKVSHCAFEALPHRSLSSRPAGAPTFLHCSFVFEVLQEALLLCGLRTLLLFVFISLVQKKKINHETQIIHLLATTRGCSCILLSLEPTTSNKWVTAAAARLPTEMTNKSNHRKKNLPENSKRQGKLYWNTLNVLINNTCLSGDVGLKKN